MWDLNKALTWFYGYPRLGNVNHRTLKIMASALYGLHQLLYFRSGNAKFDQPDNLPSFLAYSEYRNCPILSKSDNGTACLSLAIWEAKTVHGDMNAGRNYPWLKFIKRVKPLWGVILYDNVKYTTEYGPMVSTTCFRQNSRNGQTLLNQTSRI